MGNKGIARLNATTLLVIYTIASELDFRVQASASEQPDCCVGGAKTVKKTFQSGAEGDNLLAKTDVVLKNQLPLILLFQKISAFRIDLTPTNGFFVHMAML